MHELRTIAEFYAGFGPLAQGVPRAFAVRDMRGFQNGVIAPVFVTGALTSRALIRLAHWFDERRDRARDSEPKAYIDLLRGRGALNQRVTERVIEQHGWEQTRRKNLLLWTREVRAPAARDFVTATAIYGDSARVNAAFWASMVNFPALDPAFPQRFHRFLMERRRRVLVSAAWRGSEVVAGGLAVVARGKALLLCGSVLPAARGHGLWHTLVAERQCASRVLGANTWLAASSNSKICDKAERIIPVMEYRAP